MKSKLAMLVSLTCLIFFALIIQPAKADLVWVSVSPYEAVLYQDGSGRDSGPFVDWKIRFRIPSYVPNSIWNTWKPEPLTWRAGQAFEISWNSGGYRRYSVGGGYDVVELTAGFRARGYNTWYPFWLRPRDWGREMRLKVLVWNGRV